MISGMIPKKRARTDPGRNWLSEKIMPKQKAPARF
jgi:hypothetical protein